MSALDIIMHDIDIERYPVEFIHAANVELAQLRADVARLTQERDAARELINQSLTDCVAILNMNDDPHVFVMLNHLANQFSLWIAAHPAPEALLEEWHKRL